MASVGAGAFAPCTGPVRLHARGRWIKGFQKRVGIYPEILLARVVGGVNARESEAAMRKAMEIGARLVRSPLFDEIEHSLRECFAELDGLNRSVLDRLATPILIPVLADDEDDRHGGDIVRRRRRLRIDLPTKLYAGANSMASRSRALALAPISRHRAKSSASATSAKQSSCMTSTSAPMRGR